MSFTTIDCYTVMKMWKGSIVFMAGLPATVCESKLLSKM